jgi:hypothetical protein
MPSEKPGCARQSNRDLHDAVAETFQQKEKRPILWHLNADSSWLLSLPYPDDALCPLKRRRFNILIDPWLRGSQSDLAGWFSTQWHKVPSSVQTIQELNQVLRSSEDARSAAIGISRLEDGLERTSSPVPTQENYIDAVICAHEFSDHCHRQTLEEVDPSVPCFATSKAATLIQSWNHFEQVVEVPSFGKRSDWTATSSTFLPQWLGIAQLVRKFDPICFHSAVAIFFNGSTASGRDGVEAVLYSPHGIRAKDVRCMAAADPPVNPLALIHGLHSVSIASMRQLNLGAPNGFECLRTLKARYWIGTHDEVKVPEGFLAPFLRRKAFSHQGVLKGKAVDQGEADLLRDRSNYVELANGQHLLLN